MNPSSTAPTDHMSPEYRAAEAIIDNCNYAELQLFMAPRYRNHHVGAGELVAKYKETRPEEEEGKSSTKGQQAREKIRGWMRKMGKKELKQVQLVEEGSTGGAEVGQRGAENGKK